MIIKVDTSGVLVSTMQIRMSTLWRVHTGKYEPQSLFQRFSNDSTFERRSGDQLRVVIGKRFHEYVTSILQKVVQGFAAVVADVDLILLSPDHDTNQGNCYV